MFNPWILLAIFVGCALRTLWPYVVTGLKVISKGTWSDWPAFEPRYLSAFVLAIAAYGIALLIIPGAYAWVMSAAFVNVVALSYTGQNISRDVIKLVSK